MSKLRTHWFRWALALGLVLAVGLGTVRAARAIEIDDDGIIEADEVIDDDVFISGESVVVDGTVNGNLFAAGGSVTINGTVNGDLIVTGANVTVNGSVDGSLAFGGQTLEVSGPVGGSVYATGSSVVLERSATVGRNVLFTGFGLQAEPGSEIGRDLLVGGYQALLYGQVERDVRAEVGALEIAGTVGGDVTATVGEPGVGMPPTFQFPGLPAMVGTGLRVAEDAEIGGTLTYASPVEQEDAIEATPAGGIEYQFAAPGKAARPTPRVSIGLRIGNWFLARLRDFVTLLALGGLAVWQVPALLDRLADRVRTKPLPATGWGLLTLVVGYVGAAVLAVLILIVWVLLGLVTLGGLARTVSGIGFSGLGLVFAVFSLLVAYGSKLVVAYLVGKLLVQAIAPQYADRKVWPLLVGVALYVLLRAIPVLGWVVGVAATLAGLGAMWLVFLEWRTAAAGGVRG